MIVSFQQTCCHFKCYFVFLPVSILICACLCVCSYVWVCLCLSCLLVGRPRRHYCFVTKNPTIFLLIRRCLIRVWVCNSAKCLPICVGGTKVANTKHCYRDRSAVKLTGLNSCAYACITVITVFLLDVHMHTHKQCCHIAAIAKCH